MRVKSEQDVRDIVAAVDRLLGPLERRVHSIVNYERFGCDDEVFATYVDAVKYVEQTYYLSVRRYTGNAFLRHQLGNELAKRQLMSEVLPSAGARPHG
jgi:propionate CoA-transferase